MSNGPVSGDGIAVTIPLGKTAFWAVTSQAAWNQFVQLKDSGGGVIFTATGASPDGHSPTQIGQGSFVAQDASGNYQLFIGTNNGSSWSSVLWDELALDLAGTTKEGSYCFISEDGADQDFNDSCTSLTWFASIG